MKYVNGKEILITIQKNSDGEFKGEIFEIDSGLHYFQLDRLNDGDKEKVGEIKNINKLTENELFNVNVVFEILCRGFEKHLVFSNDNFKIVMGYLDHLLVFDLNKKLFI